MNQPVGVPNITWKLSTNPELVDNLSVGIATPIPKAENI